MQYNVSASLLLPPEAADGGQLSALASITRKLRNPTITTALRGVRDCAEMQAPTKYELVVNLKTAKALGLTPEDRRASHP
jgi:hypothetical protein